MTTTDPVFQDVIDAMQNAEECGGPTGDDYDRLMSSISEEALRRIATRRSNATHPSPCDQPSAATREHETAKAVAALLDARGMRATWEFPGCIRVEVPNGKAALLYGTANADWSGHYEPDEDGRSVDGWEPQTLPIDATPEAIAIVLIDGYATSQRQARIGALTHAAALVVETHRSVPDPRRRPTFCYWEPCKGYAMIDGPQHGLIFHTSDDPPLGATVQVVYHPDDQYARTYVAPSPTLDQLRERAADEVDALVDHLYLVAGYDPETACLKKGHGEGDLDGIGPEECQKVLSSLASFLSCIASDDLPGMPAFSVMTLSGLLNGLRRDLDISDGPLDAALPSRIGEYAEALEASETTTTSVKEGK